MKRFFKKVSEKTKEWADLSREELIFHAIPHQLGELLSKYFRMDIEGLENLPREGRLIVAANHSGFSGFDAFLLCHHIYKHTGQTPRVLTHHFWFLNPITAIPAQKLGFINANRGNGSRVLQRNHWLLVFPEGEQGNFKPSTQKYQLQTFKRGVIRLARENNAPVLPTLVIGAEETHINLAQIQLPPLLKNLLLPLPLNLFPLPARWKIKFLDPIHYGKNDPTDSEDTEQKIRYLAEDLRDYMQVELDKEIELRKHIFI